MAANSLSHLEVYESMHQFCVCREADENNMNNKLIFHCKVVDVHLNDIMYIE